jgi:hypothetical protein
MMISGAAKDSDPHRVASMGADGEMKRDNPKSVSLMSGEGRAAIGTPPAAVDGKVKGFVVNIKSACQRIVLA